MTWVRRASAGGVVQSLAGQAGGFRGAAHVTSYNQHVFIQGRGGLLAKGGPPAGGGCSRRQHAGGRAGPAVCIPAMPTPIAQHR